MQRRQFFEAVGTAGLGAMMVGRTRAESPPRRSSAAGLLDHIRDKVRTWTASLWDAGAGGFRQNREVGANLLSSTDVAWLRYAVNDPDPRGSHPDEWIRYLQQGQDPKTGAVSYGPGPGGQGHSNGHAMWQTVRALNILGGQLLYFPHYLRRAITVEGLKAWFDSVDWDGPRSNHHEVLGLVPLLANLNDRRWTDTFFEKIAQQQNPENGAFPRSNVNISRTFAYTALHRATGRMPPRAEKIVDLMLALQDARGFWQKVPAFSTMDAAYILVRLPPILNHRRTDARRSLERLARALLEFYPQSEQRITENPHWMLAIVHTFGLLAEAFPEGFPSQRPYRFDWDRPSMYQCDVIAREAGRSYRELGI
jgi:hypothetical protein